MRRLSARVPQRHMSSCSAQSHRTAKSQRLASISRARHNRPFTLFRGCGGSPHTGHIRAIPPCDMELKKILEAVMDLRFQAFIEAAVAQAKAAQSSTLGGRDCRAHRVLDASAGSPGRHLRPDRTRSGTAWRRRHRRAELEGNARLLRARRGVTNFRCQTTRSRSTRPRTPFPPVGVPNNQNRSWPESMESRRSITPSVQRR